MLAFSTEWLPYNILLPLALEQRHPYNQERKIAEIQTSDRNRYLKICRSWTRYSQLQPALQDGHCSEE